MPHRSSVSVHICASVFQVTEATSLRGFNLGKSTIRFPENDDVSSRFSLMVSLSMSIQQVTNRDVMGVSQGQGLAYSQYDDNSTLAFSDSPWQLSSNIVAYFVFLKISSTLL